MDIELEFILRIKFILFHRINSGSNVWQHKNTAENNLPIADYFTRTVSERTGTFAGLT